MARLTILQASQQGFGSTLTIHRHIKDGSLPIYEEGDVKLLEVDDLIALFGEPGIPVNDNQTTSEPVEIDIYEYNRMRSELDQKNKKNMWLAADLAEVVRELKEKEAKFDAERARLLKILEQAQALLLREARRAGAGLKKSDVSALKIDQATGKPAPAEPAVSQTSAVPPATPDGPTGQSPFEPRVEMPRTEPPADHEQPLDTMPNDKSEEPAPADEPVAAVPEEANNADNAQDDSEIDLPSIVVDGDKRRKRGLSDVGVSRSNPLVPPVEDEDTPPPKSRLMGTIIIMLLLTIAGGGFVFFRFQTQIMNSVAEIMKVLGGA